MPKLTEGFDGYSLSIQIQGVYDGVCIHVDHEGNMTNRFKPEDPQWRAVESWMDRFYPDRHYWPGTNGGWKGSNPINQEDEE